MSTRRAAALMAGVGLALTGCSAFEDPPPPTRITAPPESLATAAPTTTPEFTTADGKFSQLMIPHHVQAVELAELVPERTDSPEVLALAEEIKDAQQPETDRMTAWLQEWGLETETDVEGMLTDDEIQELRDLEGPEFDRRWLESMILHHEGAVLQAQTVLAAGVHRPTRALAEEISLTKG
ncbi:MAG: DUF305 domain-containing protein [Intrasporangiaceae bacterium]|nr:DUF305 domain-containing protein [Intrasporangiaceae bacterium]